MKEMNKFKPKSAGQEEKKKLDDADYTKYELSMKSNELPITRDDCQTTTEELGTVTTMITINRKLDELDRVAAGAFYR
uniref:Uncharacterized protein n=1 Tax=Romanomermis culicivorax TaxID=13658 RepID=A0A915KF31_ROMCU